MSWTACAFVIVLGLSEATMVRVARARGSRQGALARQAGLIGILVSVGIMLILAIVPITMPFALSAIFLDPGDPATEEVTQLAAALLLIAAFFGVFDGLQAVATRALRGLRDTVVPVWFAAFGYWADELRGLGTGGDRPDGRAWINHLLLNTQLLPESARTSHGYFNDVTITLMPLERAQAEAQLAGLVALYRSGMDAPAPLLPGTAWAVLAELDVRSTFENEVAGSMPATRLYHTMPDSLALQAYAETLWSLLRETAEVTIDD